MHHQSVYNLPPSVVHPFAFVWRSDGTLRIKNEAVLANNDLLLTKWLGFSSFFQCSSAPMGQDEIHASRWLSSTWLSFTTPGCGFGNSRRYFAVAGAFLLAADVVGPAEPPRACHGLILLVSVGVPMRRAVRGRCLLERSAYELLFAKLVVAAVELKPLDSGSPPFLLFVGDRTRSAGAESDCARCCGSSINAC